METPEFNSVDDIACYHYFWWSLARKEALAAERYHERVRHWPWGMSVRAVRYLRTLGYKVREAGENIPFHRLGKVGNIIAFESGELSASRTLELFSHLVKTGLAWSLQGSYGRTAHALIQNGYLGQDGAILREVEE